ncbi:hypothetical protein H5T51_05010, partial [Candidatus Bathyarchaeota archaeon]|nr:hypothetical protein [Candidatus Bathyarchaeota archaeon]
NFTVTATAGNLSFIGLGHDPEFKQPRIQVQFYLNPGGDNVEVLIEAEGAVQADYIAVNRPLMNGSDRVTLFVQKGIFKEIYDDQTFSLYEIVPP